MRKKREFIDEDELEDLYRIYRKNKKTNRPLSATENLFDNSTFKMNFDDTYYKKQWYLVSECEREMLFDGLFFLLSRRMKDN